MNRRGAGLLASLLLGCSAPAADGGEETETGEDPSAREDEHGRFALGGIVIDRLTFDQAVSTDVFAHGVAVPPSDYLVPVLSDRTAYIRAHWNVPEAWEPREIEARLAVRHPDGSVDYGSDLIEVSGPSNENWLEGAFSWVVPGTWIEPGLQVDVTLYETDDAFRDDAPPDPAARAPAHGSLEVEISGAEREMDLLVVRIEHDYDGGKQCGGAPDVDEAMQQDMRERLLAINPVERVNLSVRDEIMVFSEPANNFAVILDALSALREADGAPPWLYYYGLIDLCDWGSDAGFSGQARVPDELTKDYAWKRVAVGTVRVSYGGIIGTFVHEVGHTQGRYHVPCDGESVTEKDYPYRGGMTASVGFDNVKWVLHPATHRDYMSYCSPDWIGEYGWNKSVPVAETLTAWKLEGASWEEPARSLVGSIYPDGTESWWVVRGQPALGSTTGRVRFTLEDGSDVEVGARVAPHVLGEGLEVVAPLPAPLSEVAAIERVGMPGAPTVDVARLRALSTH